MERACRLLLEWGFAEQGLRTVVWLAHVGNWASRRLAWRLGFRFEGTLRAAGCPSAASCVDAWVGTLLARRAAGAAGDAGSTYPVLEGDGVRLRPCATRTTSRGSSRPAATSARAAGSAELPAPYTTSRRAGLARAT